MASSVAHSENLAFFAGKNLSSAIKRTFIETVQPRSSFGKLQNGLFFSIRPDPDFFIDLRGSTLYLELEIAVLEDGVEHPITDQHNVTLINYPICSIFKNVDFILNGVNLTKSTGDLYYLKGLIDALLFNSESECKKLELGGFTPDKAGEI